jgi:hypothetical protein
MTNRQRIDVDARHGRVMEHPAAPGRYGMIPYSGVSCMRAATIAAPSPDSLYQSFMPSTGRAGATPTPGPIGLAEAGARGPRKSSQGAPAPQPRLDIGDDEVYN